MNKEQRSIVKKLAGIVMVFILVLTTINPAFAESAKKAPKLNAEETTIVAGKSFNFNIKNKIKGSSYKWTVANKEIATVNEKNGVVTGLEKGVTNVFCRISVGKTSYLLKAKVNVLRPAVRVSISNPIVLLEVGESYRLEADVIPKSSNDYVSWFSSDDSVLKVDDKGKMAATKTGIATITAMTVSGRKDSLDIKVVPAGEKAEYSKKADDTEDKAGENDKADAEDNKGKNKGVKYQDLTITKDNIDSYNEILIIDKTYENLYIDASVGDADIYLAGVSIKNLLVMDSGNYSLYMYESTAKELRIDELPKEVWSFAIDENEDRAPNLIIGENTQIDDLNARISASIRQEDGSAIEGLRVTQDENGRITIYLDNYTGGLLLDSSLGDMEIVASGCNLSGVNVSGNENSGNITLTNAGSSDINNLTVSGTANLNLGIPTANVNIDENALNNSITISGSVENVEANGANGAINVASGGNIGSINLNGEGTSLFGEGTVNEANVNANNCNINTNNTLVTVGTVNGTRIQGREVGGGSTTNASTPAQGGDSSNPPSEVAVTGISLNHETMWLKPAGTGTIIAMVSPENASNKVVTWVSSNTNIATVENGVVTAKKAGTVDITATAGGRTALCVVTVESKEEDFEFDTTKGTITGYKGSGGAVVVPMTIDNVVVENIGSYAFMRMDYDIWEPISNNISSLILPSGLLSLGYGALSYSKDMESIFISDSVISIQNDVFEGCNKLREVIVDEASSVYSSMNGVLYNKDKTEILLYPIGRQESSFEIPSSITFFNNYILSMAEKLENINVEEGNSVYSSMDGVLYNKDKTKLILYPGGKLISSFEIPNSVITVVEYAFNNCNKLKSVTFQEPVQVVNIERYAFAYNSGLEAITIPASVTSIGDSAFYLAEKLEQINVEGSNTKYADIDGVLYSKDKTLLIRYPGGRPATSYEIPNNTVKINESAFSRSYNIVSINFEEASQATHIENGAFTRCDNLESIVLPNSISEISSYAFYCCDKLKSITIDVGVTLGFDILDNNNNVFKNAYLSGGAGTYTKGTDGKWTKAISPITTIATISGRPMVGKELSAGALTPAAATATYQWMSCDTVDGTYISITGATAGTYTPVASDADKYIKVTATGTGDFSGSVTSTAVGFVESPESDFEFNATSGTITGYKGSGGTVVIPKIINDVVVEHIGKFAFSCSDIDIQVVIPNNVSKVIIPDSVISIGDYAFHYCTDLASINFQGSSDVIFEETSKLTTIKNGVFSFCESLTSINIPASVTSIGGYVFYGCTSLKTINIDTSNTEYIDVDGVLYNKSKTTLLCYPAGKTDTSYVILNGVTIIAEAFACCSMLTSVVFPDSLNTIGENAFYYCIKLTDLTIPGNITMQTGALSDCINLKRITIGNNVTVYSYLLSNNNYFFVAYKAGGAGTYTGTYDGAWTKAVEPTAVAVTGSAITYVGDTLTAIITPEDATNITYQWRANTGDGGMYMDISGATNVSFTITDDFVGKKIRVKIIGASGKTYYSNETTEVKTK